MIVLIPALILVLTGAICWYLQKQVLAIVAGCLAIPFLVTGASMATGINETQTEVHPVQSTPTTTTP